MRLFKFFVICGVIFAGIALGLALVTHNPQLIALDLLLIKFPPVNVVFWLMAAFVLGLVIGGLVSWIRGLFGSKAVKTKPEG